MSDLLDRDIALAATAHVRNAASPVLREVIDHGLAAFERCSATAEGHDTPLGILFPFYHALEMLDGVEILLDAAADVPATVTLRAVFEALLSLQWTAADRSERRGAAYFVAEVHRRIARMERLDSQTERGKQLKATLAKDPIGKTLVLPDDPAGAADRAGLLAVLEQPHLKEAAAEYSRVRDAKKRTPEFFALWDGPADIERLARELGRSAYYEILYRHWSGTAHANDLARQLRESGGAPAITRLRSGSELQGAYAHAIYFGIEAIRIVLERYRPGELATFWSWYNSKVQPVYRKLTPRP